MQPTMLVRPLSAMLFSFAVVLVTGACSDAGLGDGDAMPPGDPDAAPSSDAEDGPGVRFTEPVAAHEYRRSIPVAIIVDSPLAGLREAGVEIDGERRVLCGDWPVVVGLQCGTVLGVWELDLGAGAHALRAFVTDVEGRTATSEVAVTVRPHVRPLWELSGNLLVHPPVVAGELILAPSDKLYAIDRASGVVRWAYDAAHGGPFDRIQGVIADGERAYAVKDWDSDMLVALDLATGDVVWEVPLGGPVFSRPVWDGDGHIVVADSASDLWAYRPDGTLAWQLDLDSAGDRIPAIVPVVGPDGTIYEMPVGRNQIVHVSAAGAVLGTIALVDDWHSGLTIAADGTIYAADDDGLRSYGPDGDLVTFLPTSGHVVEPVRLGSGGRVYVAAQWGGVFVLDGAGSVLWDRPMPDLIRGTPFEAPDGSLFIGALGYEYAYQVDADGSPMEELPYCDEPDGFTADGDVVYCTRANTLYAVSLASLRAAP